MATQTVEFRAATGLTLTAKLFAAGSDTQVDSQSTTEATNRKGTYSVAYTDVAAGTYVLIAFSGSTPVASWWVDLTLTTATFQTYDMPLGAVQTVTTNNDKTGYSIAGSLNTLDDLVNYDQPSALVERSPDDTKPIRFTWPVSGATITATVSIDGGAFGATTGTVSSLYTDAAGVHWYSLSYNAADRPSGEGAARYILVDGTYTLGFSLRVEAPSTDAAAVADAVWDEAYADHTNAGTFGKLMDIIRKANLSVDGTVAGTPTVNTFDTDLTDPTSTHKHQLLVFTSGTLTGVSRPILSYSSTNGQIILQEDLPSAPSASDEFTILIQHVHPVSEIQAGLATTTDVTDSEAVITGILATIASYIDTEVAAIKTKTDNLPADPATETTLATLDTLLDAIKAVTDQFRFTVANQVDANALTGGGGGDATAANQASILAAIGDLGASALSAATWTAGSITGFPASLVVGDSYTADVGRHLRIYYRDSLGDPIATIGSKAMTDGDFSATLVISQDNQSARVIGTCTWVDPEDLSEDYLKVEIPHSQSRRASAGTATLQLKFRWDGGIEVEVARQSIVWTPNI